MNNLRNSNVSMSSLIPRAVFNTILDNVNLNVCHTNVQSLTARRFTKFNELKMNFCNSKMDIICMSETWLDESINDQMIAIDGYKLFRNDRNRHGGGICVYLRHNLKCRLLRKSSNSEEATQGRTEFLCLEVECDSERFLLGIYYNPPDTDCSQLLFSHCEEFTVRYKSTFFLGDFNTDLLKNTSRKHSFNEVISTTSYTCVNSEPTFFHRTGCSLLDLLITDSPDRIITQHQVSMPGVSKHDLIFFSFDIRSQPKEPIFYRDYKNFDATSLQTAFNHYNWNDFMSISNPNTLIECFNERFKYLHDTFIPLRRVKRNENAWYTNEIDLAIINRNMAYSNWKRSKCVINEREYKRHRNIVNLLIRKAKDNYEKRIINLNVPSKVLWNNIKKLGSGKQCSYNDYNDFTSDSINNYFCSNFVSETPRIHSLHSNPAGFHFRLVESHEIVNAMFSVKSNAMGLDNISIKFLKIMLPLALSLYKHIFNSIIDTTIYPSLWKYVKVIPIKKKSSSASLTNLRPISLLCSLSKVFEKLISSQISIFLNDMSFLSPFQSGFRKNHSTNTALLKVHDDISQAIDKKGIAVLLLIDFAKAFDRVSHTKLLQKLCNSFQFSNAAARLIESYLQDRFQAVFCNSSLSPFEPIKSGVPQGSILGPLLFSIFINDLPVVLQHCSVHMFADDVQLYLCVTKNICHREIALKINSDLNKIYEWSCRNKLPINSTKTQALLINKFRVSIGPIEIHINHEQIDFVNQVKNLGVVFTHNLDWDNQVSLQCGKIYGTLKQLNMVTKHLAIPTKLRLFKTLLLPHFTYCDFLYSNASYISMNKLRVAFNACVRYTYNLSRYSSVTHLHGNLIGCPFSQFYTFRTCLTMFRLINQASPNYLRSKLISLRNTRTRNFLVPRHCTAYYGQTLFVRGIVNWNSLPVRIKSICTMKLFKQELLTELQ